VHIKKQYAYAIFKYFVLTILKNNAILKKTPSEHL